jgi:signal transduction histidine kinase/HAMP domain-containing protein/DNA-binding response OmpR family regulator
MEQRTSIGAKASPRKSKAGGATGNGKAKASTERRAARGERAWAGEALDRGQLLTALVAFKKGDFSARLPIDLEGLDGKIADTFNDVVELNDRMAKELERLGRVVGKEGKITQRASIGEVSGAWSDTVASVNALVSDLVHPTSETARVIGAVAKGDLSQTMALEVSGRPLEGEFLRTAKTVNTMVDQLSSFASEVTRVAREVGTEGKLGGQAEVKGVAGTWKDLTDSVNSMAGNLTSQVRNIAAVTTAVANGDLSKKITVDVKGEILELKNTINTMVDQLRSFASEVTRVAREVGTEGKLGGQADVRGVAGTWKDLTDSVNSMAGNLTVQVRNIAAVTTAVASGDLSKKITVDVRGEILELKDTINTMVDQLNSFASEVTRVAREVGTEGKLGGQAEVRGVAGTWKDLTDNVNFMAGNLTNQVRGIAKVVTAVANGDLKRKLAVNAKGEIAELADTINGMIETLATFADQVTTVAREVGVEGKLGGQASVPGAAGTWKDLTDNVNRLAANLTTQVRAIAEVATAVTKGDLTRSIKVEAQGEVAALKDNINEMIRNLKDTTLKNSEQDWLKTNLAKFSRMLQGQKDLLTVGRLILSELAPVVSAQQGVFYTMDATKDEAVLKLLASYAYKERKNIDNQFRLGEGLVGQCALEKEKILLLNAPKDYITITSGLGEATPLNIIVMPVLFEGQVKAILELASFERFSPTHQAFLDQLTESIGIVLNTIEANMRTEDLLKQSQSLARELQSQQEELQQTNAELGEKARLLAEQNVEVERKNREVEQARQALEEKARQLALTSKYKSEFLANMSHELRTPLNSLLILSDQLSKNGENNLTGRQVEFARTIHSSGNDLLALINDILDLSKIESGTVVVDVGEVSFKDLADYVERTFRHVAEQRRLEFELDFAPSLPRALHTDAKRLQQVLKNLLSNAFKFTERGKVSLEARVVTTGWNGENEVLSRAGSAIALSVRDTGIGILPDKQQIIFEAFQQADGSTSRKYGGTGLGLAISREIARMLGGEIRLSSVPGGGSTFTLYLPQTYVPMRIVRRKDTQLGPESSPSAGARTHVSGPPSVKPLPSPRPPPEPQATAIVQLPDDAGNLQASDLVLLIVENDMGFARFLLDVAREHGWKGVLAHRGAAALAIVHEVNPSAITLDIHLPDIDGFRVLDRLKHDLGTRHIPVQVISTGDERERALRMGARGVLQKPLKTREALDDALTTLQQFVAAPTRRLLLVVPDDAERGELLDLLGGPEVSIVPAATGAEALRALEHEPLDLLVIGVELDDMPALAFVDAVQRDEGASAALPILVYAPGEMSASDEAELGRRAQGLALKHVRSRERLVDEVALFLHQRVADLPDEKREIVEQLHDEGAVLTGKRVLVVDDDIRNIFALVTVLDAHNMKTLSAETGRSAIDLLEATPDIDIVLMDIMMPEMDGYDTIRAIRERSAYQALPIIAVTAKAMKGDREKCFEAGATDYISKPVDPEQLIAMLRVWLHR